MADLMNVLMEARSGNLAIKLSRDFTKLLDGVLETNMKGEMLIKIGIKPSKTDDGQVEVTIVTESRVKIPELGIGAAIFFVTPDKELTRTDPRQSDLFDGERIPAREGGR